ncbi:hypothetical protein [Gilvibacter sp. SZ-19]|jgi:hypothetical protein|uniref:hypothetical protein n=1 Tax=unclassified Gilvibacter TaxID=2625242 RepID=UPI000B3C1CAB|nr:hypothetical protein [Gilvibacter sp. SZ-19]ARV12026.1 hypothetical protein BTO09_06545 [Gilvibacter sp. SZ-19]
MIQIDKKNNTELLEQSVQHLQQKGFENIKADLDGYETPKSYRRKGSDLVITPDITAQRDGRKHFFEVSVKSEKPTLLKTKWRFLDVMTNLKDHRFKIITARGHYSFTRQMLDELNLEKKLIKLN